MKRLGRYTRYICIVTVGLLSLFLFSETALAQTVVENNLQTTDFGIEAVDENIALSNDSLILIITRIIRAVLGLLGIIFLGLILYAGFMWMTSQGQEDKIATAKKTLINAIIGLIIIMSAFAIVQFVINALSDATSTRGEGPDGRIPTFEDFNGSGALGDAITDHYPTRSQQDVPRNTKVIITFREALNPSDVIINTNNTCMSNGDIVSCDDVPDGQPVYGDCLEPSEGELFSWQAHCDQLNTTTIQITERDNTEDTPVEAAVLAMQEDVQQTQIKTLTIRPYEQLGSSNEAVWYRVQLTNDITNTDGESIFRSSRSLSYHWDFRIDTLLDQTPPRIVSVYPNNGEKIARNTIIQVTFDEPMDPVAVQGMVNTEQNPFTHLIFNRTDVVGQWRVSNNYRTVEFIPAEECGVTNSCGEQMYCLPVTDCDREDGSCTYETLIRTAQRISDDSWEAFPFSGVHDMAGNALDGDGDGVRDTTPFRPTNLLSIHENEKLPDNYHWEFIVENTIDRRIPYPYQIYPGVDAQQIKGSIPVQIQFSMPMFLETLYDINILEHSTSSQEFWTRPSFSTEAIPGLADGAYGTRAKIDHRDFGPNDTNSYYFITIPGTVRGINQNCMYPGYGPSGDVSGDTGIDSCIVREDGHTIGCVDVTTNEENDTGCAFDPDGTGDQSVHSTEACIELLKAESL